MNTAQFLAADPKVSAWVAASAGTGKTKVLTDRILNLLLHGFAPERILCLTFTKAAAAEMANRLTQQLARWATLSMFELTQELEKLLGINAISPTVLVRAQTLFALVLDAPGGMKIQTIHGFCQSILSRFPLEAGISPHFRVLDDVQTEEMVLEAQYATFANPAALVRSALEILNPFMADNGFNSIMSDVFQHRARVMGLLASHKTFWDYVREVLIFLKIDAIVERPEEILDVQLVDFLKAQFAPSVDDFEAYVSQYLTQEKEIRKKFLNSEHSAEAERIFQFVRSLSALEVAQRTAATLFLFQEILKEYEDRKTRRCVLDYDDLITQTQKLLSQPGVSSWVLYKLDGGIDHLLVDEAQDTNTAQWEIIQSLTTEFLTSDKPYRTIFVVGDAKQSIYSFQGANPKEFLRLKSHFANLSQKVEQDWREVQLDLSYRSTTAILEIVDQVFANSQNRRGISFDEAEIVHHAFRENHPGLVELWPLIEPEEAVGEIIKEEWHLPLERLERITPEAKLARYLAKEVEQWITSKRILPSTKRPVQPRDILILVRKRTVLGQEIVRALKQRNIPVAGADRLVLTDHIAIMDLLALGQFVLLPEDDLTLACVLRSPLIGMSEDDLFSLAHGRVSTLWESLSSKAKEHSVFEEAHAWLKACLRQADLTPVYEFYSWVLTQGEGRQRLLSRLGQEIEDVLEEFLTQSLAYDQDHASSLQGFVHFMNHQSQEIKRDASDTVHNQVRLMTVHGSKGLQAPIVILPDAAESGKGKRDTLLWTDSLLLLRPTQSQDTEGTKYFKQKSAEAETEEKRRLLYVALTRAQDYLYVGGWTSKDLPEDCWYRLIEDALKIKSGTNSYFQGDHEQAENFSEDKYLQEIPSLPVWSYSQHIDIKRKNNQSSERKVPPNAAMERGTLIHRFFEYLPQLPENRRYEAACQMVEKEKLTHLEWEKDINATLQILEDPSFKELFSSTSLAEVPVSGLVNGMPFQGRIDRLLVMSDQITIVDYKTDRNPPADADVPYVYAKQLESYAMALRTIYPNHKIRKIILWVAVPRIQEIE